MKMKWLLILLLQSTGIIDNVDAQTYLPVANSPLEDIFRRKQLTNDSSQYSLSDVSFMVRPISLEPKLSEGKAFQFKLLPIQHMQQFNSKTPLHYADGSMYPTKGWQGFYSAGIEAKLKNVLVRLKPEYTWAFNPRFPTFPSDHYNIIWNYYYQWLNRIDAPERFAQEPLRKLFAGQSRIQYAYKGIAIGISTENLWWGPGRFNSLVMSNNAPGFQHYTFHTDKPLHTPVGSFEWQLVLGGKLNNSGTLPQERNRAFNGSFIYVAKDSVHNRSFSGGVITWQPKWLPGLFIGTDGASIKYKGKIGKSAKMGSIFARYLLPEENAEMYFQYGRSDKFATVINVLQDTIPRGYLAGVRKLFPLNLNTKKTPSFLELGIEITQLQVPNLSLIRQAKSWYTDANIRHGFTHEGQVLGASIGPGSNSQRLSVSWIKGESKVGIEFERLLHNADFYYNYNYNSGSNDFNRQWVDLSASLVWNFPVKQWMFFGQFSFIRSINYNWKSYIPQPVTPTNYFSDGYDLINLHGRIGFIYNVVPIIKKR